MKEPFRQHLKSARDLETTREAYRAGFIALALEKNHRATPFVERAWALKEAASRAKSAAELLDMEAIQSVRPLSRRWPGRFGISSKVA